MAAESILVLGELVMPSAEATERFGERVGAVAPAGLVVALDGELGAGKTCFVRGFARGLGASEPVSSPTYALQHVYSGRHELWHFDAWRAGQGAALLAELGPEELGRGAVVVVEWASRVRELLPAPRLEIVLAHLDASTRLVDCRWRGAARPDTDAERRFCADFVRIARELRGGSRVRSGPATGTPPDETPR